MANTRIWYLNRDSSNYKTYHSPVLAGEMTEEQWKRICVCLFEDESFIPDQVGLDDTRNWIYDPEVDHPWWELAGYELVSQAPTIKHPTVKELVAWFETVNGQWDSMPY